MFRRNKKNVYRIIWKKINLSIVSESINIKKLLIRNKKEMALFDLNANGIHLMPTLLTQY